jgi:hypothetical protein
MACLSMIGHAGPGIFRLRAYMSAILLAVSLRATLISS